MLVLLRRFNEWLGVCCGLCELFHKTFENFGSFCHIRCRRFAAQVAMRNEDRFSQKFCLRRQVLLRMAETLCLDKRLTSEHSRSVAGVNLILGPILVKAWDTLIGFFEELLLINSLYASTLDASSQNLMDLELTSSRLARSARSHIDADWLALEIWHFLLLFIWVDWVDAYLFRGLSRLNPFGKTSAVFETFWLGEELWQHFGF